MLDTATLTNSGNASLRILGITPEEAHSILQEHGATATTDANAVRLATRAKAAHETQAPNLGEGGLSPKRAAAEMARRETLALIGAAAFAHRARGWVGGRHA